MKIIDLIRENNIPYRYIWVYKNERTGKKYIGKNCFIPRIDLSASETDFPFHFVRRQFPVKLAFACTINKVRNVEIIKMFDFIQKD